MSTDCSSVEGRICSNCGVWIRNNEIHICYYVTPVASGVPHKCPCCDGWGKRALVVPLDTTSERLTICPSCGGTGIVWSSS